MVLSFAERKAQWANPPVDDVGYLSSEELLSVTNERLMMLLARAQRARYGGWRNYQGNWRRLLGLDSTQGKDVLDYGCGIGIEALEYAAAGNRVSLADISESNVDLAARVLSLYGYEPARRIYLDDEGLADRRLRFDVIHCSGVLHHIPEPEVVVAAMARWLRPGGELRLMVYSDEAWRIATGTEPPERVEDDPDFERYWQRWDGLGGYADWYSRPRLEQRFGKWFDLARCEYLTEHREYLGAVLVKLERSGGAEELVGVDAR